MDILELDQLRIDMEAIRDDLIDQYQQYMAEDNAAGNNHAVAAASLPSDHSLDELHRSGHEDDHVHSFEKMFARKSSIFSYSVDPSTAAGLNSRHASLSAASPASAGLNPQDVADAMLLLSPQQSSASAVKDPSPLNIPSSASVASPASPPPPVVLEQDLPDTLEGRYELSDGPPLGGGKYGPLTIVLKAAVSKTTRQRVLVKVI